MYVFLWKGEIEIVFIFSWFFFWKLQFSKGFKYLQNIFFYLLQANEETGNRRPVMISLTETPKPVLDIKENKSDDKSSDEEMKDITDQVQKTSTENNDQAEQQTKTNQLLPKLKKLSDIECSTLLHACVSLMVNFPPAFILNFRSPPLNDLTKKLGRILWLKLISVSGFFQGLSVDADALNAILRLLLRLTQDFEQAVVFAQLGGVKMLLVSFQTFMIKISFLL